MEKHFHINLITMSSYAAKRRKIQEEEEKLKEVTSVIVQFQTADVNLYLPVNYIG